jgi:hypothetical protein
MRKAELIRAIQQAEGTSTVTGPRPRKCDQEEPWREDCFMESVAEKTADPPRPGVGDIPNPAMSAEGPEKEGRVTAALPFFKRSLEFPSDSAYALHIFDNSRGNPKQEENFPGGRDRNPLRQWETFFKGRKPEERRASMRRAWIVFARQC